MKSVFKKTNLVLTALALAAVSGLALFFCAGESASKHETSPTPLKSSVSKKQLKKDRLSKKSTRINQAKSWSVESSSGDIKNLADLKSKDPLYGLDLDPKDVAKISDEVRALLIDMRAALSDENEKRVLSTVQRLQAMMLNGADIPRSVKVAMLNALGSLDGGAGLADAVPFLGDADKTVRTAALEEFEDMLLDVELGDRYISSVLKQVVKVVHDADALEMFMMELGDMRTSVKVDTALAVFDSGNQTAIKVLSDDLDVYFDTDSEGSLKTREDIVQYGKDNPDDPDDESIYGPMN